MYCCTAAVGCQDAHQGSGRLQVGGYKGRCGNTSERNSNPGLGKGPEGPGQPSQVALRNWNGGGMGHRVGGRKRQVLLQKHLSPFCFIRVQLSLSIKSKTELQTTEWYILMLLSGETWGLFLHLLLQMNMHLRLQALTNISLILQSPSTLTFNPFASSSCLLNFLVSFHCFICCCSFQALAPCSLS